MSITAPVIGKMVGAKTLKQIAARTSVDPHAGEPAVKTKALPPTKTPKKTK